MLIAFLFPCFVAVCREVLICLTVIIPIESTNPAPETDLTQSAFSTGSAANNGPNAGASANAAAVAPDLIDCVSVTSAVTSEMEDPQRLSNLSTDRALANELELSGSWSGTMARECYLLPALLAEPNPDGSANLSETNATNHTSAVSHISFAQKGSIQLERRFTFSRFVPSALVPRIIAKMYSRFGELLKTTSPLDNPDRSKCWKSTFIQEYGDCTVWILFEEGLTRAEPNTGGPFSPGGKKASPADHSPRSRRGSEDYQQCDENDFFAGAVNPRDRIADYGIVVSENELQDSFDACGSAEWDTSDADFIVDASSVKASTTEQLNDLPEPADDADALDIEADQALPQGFIDNSEHDHEVDQTPGDGDDEPLSRVLQLRIISFGHLLHVQSIVASLDDYSDAVQEILDEYRGVSSIYPNTLCPVCLLRQMPEQLCGQISKAKIDLVASNINELAYTPDMTDEDRLSAYTSFWQLRCPTGRCVIKPDFLVQIPEEITKLISPQAHYDALTDYIRNDIINTSLDAPNKIHRLRVDEVEKFIVNVLPVYPDESQHAMLREYFAGRLPVTGLRDFVMTNGKIRSGAYVSVPLPNANTQDASGSAGSEGVTAKLALSERNVVLSAFLCRETTDRIYNNFYFLVGGKRLRHLLC